MDIKKVELHLHLDGSINKSLAYKLLGEEVSLSVDDDCSDLNEYLTKFDIPISLMQTSENLEKISFLLAENLIEDNVIYAEIRFAPILHIKKGLTLDEVVTSVKNGLAQSRLKTTLILCMLRGMSYQDNLKIIDLAYKYNLPIDLAGAEGLYKTEDYKGLFEIIKQKNIPFTIHSGEADGSNSIKSAISFGAKRLGHGIRILEDYNLVEEAIKNNITLEVCPTSNVQTKAVVAYKDHPIKKLIDAGLKVTVSVDNMTVSNITLSEEYEKLVENFNFTEKDFYILNKNAINASFLSQNEKQKLLLELDN